MLPKEPHDAWLGSALFSNISIFMNLAFLRKYGDTGRRVCNLVEP
jgi:hypothetical protein